MSPALACAWALSMVPAVLAWLPGRGWLPPGPSALALAALPWVAMAGLPRAKRSSDAPRSPGRAPFALAMVLAPLALAAGIDLRAGIPAPALTALGLGCAALVFLLELSADRAAALGRAASSERAERLRSWAWLALVAVPLFAASLRLGAPARALPRPVELLAGSTPLGWCARNAAAESLRSGASSPWTLAPWIPAAIALGLCALGGSRAPAER